MALQFLTLTQTVSQTDIQRSDANTEQTRLSTHTSTLEGNRCSWTPSHLRLIQSLNHQFRVVSLSMSDSVAVNTDVLIVIELNVISHSVVQAVRHSISQPFNGHSISFSNQSGSQSNVHPFIPIETLKQSFIHSESDRQSVSQSINHVYTHSFNNPFIQWFDYIIQQSVIDLFIQPLSHLIQSVENSPQQPYEHTRRWSAFVSANPPTRRNRCEWIDMWSQAE